MDAKGSAGPKALDACGRTNPISGGKIVGTTNKPEFINIETVRNVLRACDQRGGKTFMLH